MILNILSSGLNRESTLSLARPKEGHSSILKRLVERAKNTVSAFIFHNHHQISSQEPVIPAYFTPSNGVSFGTTNPLVRPVEKSSPRAHPTNRSVKIICLDVYLFMLRQFFPVIYQHFHIQIPSENLNTEIDSSSSWEWIGKNGIKWKNRIRGWRNCCEEEVCCTSRLIPQWIPFDSDQLHYPMEKYSILNYLISIHHSQQQFLLLLPLIPLLPFILHLLILVSPISSMVHSLLIHLLVPLNIRPIAISLRLSPGTVDSLIESIWLQLSHLHCSYSIEWLLNGENEALFPFSRQSQQTSEFITGSDLYRVETNYLFSDWRRKTKR